VLDADRYARIVRASAFYDLVVTLPFATPFTFGILHQAVSALDAALGMPGDIPAGNALAVLMANLMGSVVIVWSILRLRLRLPILGRYDAVARFLFAVWQINALASGVTWVIVPLVAVELGFGVLQAWPIRSR
jgi:hypothetical protein